MNIQNRLIASSPQLNSGFSRLTDQQIEKAWGFGLANRFGSLHFIAGWSHQNMIEENLLQEILSNFSIEVPQHFSEEVVPSIENVQFSSGAHGGPVVSVEGFLTETGKCLAFALNITQLGDDNDEYFDIDILGTPAVNSSTNIFTGETVLKPAGNLVQWYESWIPGTIEDYTNLNYINEIRFRYRKDDGSLVSTKVYGDTRNLLFSNSDGTQTLINPSSYEVCVSNAMSVFDNYESISHFVDTTEVLPEILDQDFCLIILDDSSRNNSENNYIRFQVLPLPQETIESPPEMDLTVRASISISDVEGISNVEIEMLGDEDPNGDYPVQRIRNFYSNGHIGEWYSANGTFQIQP